MRALRPILISCFLLSSAPTLWSAPPTTQQGSAAPMHVEVYVRGDKRDTKVAGTLGDHDDTHIIIDAPGGPRDLQWDDLTASSGFTLKSRLIDKTSAADWVALGTWGWERGLETQAKAALSTARKLDQSLGGEIDALLAEKSGSKIAAAKPSAPVATATPATPPPSDEGDTKKSKSDAKGDSAATGADDQDAVAKLTPGFEKGQEIVHYTTPTPDEIAKSLERSRKFADKVRALTKTNLVELETTHFLIYTDWDPREYGFLKDKCEGAYSVLARQFALPAKDNVFVGKLPIYMFTKPSEFQSFAAKIDKFRASAYVLGYFIPTDEIGHMAMWKPGINEGVGAGQSLDDAERKWARTLVHEFSHAFINRYKSNARIPRWMNEGLAEVISEMELPTNNYRSHARELAMEGVDINGLFEDSNMPTGAAYPVMMTMVECLVKQNNKGFVTMVNAIKDGVDPEDALEKQYGMRYGKFADVWLKYAKTLQ